MKLKKLLLGITLISSLLVGCSNEPKETTQTIEIESSNTNNADDNQVKEDVKISVASVSISQILSKLNQPIVGRPTTKLPLPEEYLEVPEIGSSFSPDFEKVLAVGTELLIGDAMFKDKIEKTAKEHNIDTFYVDTATFDSFLEGIEGLGQKLNKKQEAYDLIKSLKQPLENVKDINKDLKVAIIFGSSESNMLATENTYVGSLAKSFGVKNIADEIASQDGYDNSSQDGHSVTNSGYVNLNLEQILKNQPDIILRFGHGNVEEANKAFEKLFTENPAWKSLDAIKNNKVYDLDANIFGTSANINAGEALAELGEILNEQ